MDDHEIRKEVEVQQMAKRGAENALAQIHDFEAETERELRVMQGLPWIAAVILGLMLGNGLLRGGDWQDGFIWTASIFAVVILVMSSIGVGKVRSEIKRRREYFERSIAQHEAAIPKAVDYP